MPMFECRTELICPQDKVFEYITRPANMKAISPGDVDLVFVEAPEVIAAGSRLVFKIQAFGIAQQFEHEIIEFDPPKGFRERMTKGPIPLWEHEYRLEPLGSDKVLLTNRIEFEPPGGVLGFIVTADRMLEHLEKGYAHRAEALKKALEA